MRLYLIQVLVLSSAVQVPHCLHSWARWVVPYAHNLQPFVSLDVHDEHLRLQVAPALAAGCTTVVKVVPRGLLLVAIRPFLPPQYRTCTCVNSFTAANPHLLLWLQVSEDASVTARYVVCACSAHAQTLHVA